jgi:transcriptional regulator with XRE-family HTH domain
MDLRPDMSAGDRLKVARRAAGLTQEQLADRAGVNIDTIRKLEQNRRQSMRVTTANALASVVGVETTALLLGTPTREAREDPQLQLIRRALVPAYHFAPATDAAEEDTAPALGALRHSVEDAWTLYHAGEFDSLGHLLPGLITEARVSAREHTNGSAADAHAALAKVLQLGAHTMVQNQMDDLGLLGLDRALDAAQRSGDPLLPAMISNSVAWVFLRTGRLDDSERVAIVTADDIEPTFRKSPPHHVAVYGGLLLSAITAAARHQRFDTARDLLSVAHAAAHRVGEDSTDRWTTVFGPTSVAMQAVSVEAAAGEWTRVLDLARNVPLSGKTPISWKVRFLLDVAHAQTETYRDSDAVETLRTVRRLAPGWMQRHGLATAVVRELLARKHQPAGIITLADFLGIAR